MVLLQNSRHLSCFQRKFIQRIEEKNKRIVIQPKKIMTCSYKNDHTCKKKNQNARKPKGIQMIINNCGYFASDNSLCGGLSCVLWDVYILDFYTLACLFNQPSYDKQKCSDVTWEAKPPPYPSLRTTDLMESLFIIFYNSLSKLS